MSDIKRDPEPDPEIIQIDMGEELFAEFLLQNPEADCLPSPTLTAQVQSQFVTISPRSNRSFGRTGDQFISKSSPKAQPRKQHDHTTSSTTVTTSTAFPMDNYATNSANEIGSSDLIIRKISRTDTTEDSLGNVTSTPTTKATNLPTRQPVQKSMSVQSLRVTPPILPNMVSVSLPPESLPQLTKIPPSVLTQSEGRTRRTARPQSMLINHSHVNAIINNYNNNNDNNNNNSIYATVNSKYNTGNHVLPGKDESEATRLVSPRTNSKSRPVNTSSLSESEPAKHHQSTRKGLFERLQETSEEKRANSAKRAEEEYNEYMARANQLDFTELEQTQMIYQSGVDFSNRPIVVITASLIPAKNKTTKEMEHLLLFFMKKLDPVVSRDYVLVYVHANLSSENIPPFLWLRRCYGIFSRKYKKNLKALFIVQSTSFVKGIFRLFKPFISGKFWRKLKYIDNFKDIYQFMSPTQVKVPIDLSKTKTSTEKPKMFGMDLTQAMMLPVNEDTLMPIIVVKSVQYLLLHGIATEGIFRLSGSLGRIEEYKAAFDRGDDVDLSTEPEPHVISGLLKSYLRELPDPLMSYDLYPEWTKAIVPSDTKATLLLVKSLLRRLPETNVFVLRALMGLLFRIAQNQETNKMPAPNLAICWAPNILKSREESPETALRDAGIVNRVVQVLIENHVELFVDI